MCPGGPISGDLTRRINRCGKAWIFRQSLRYQCIRGSFQPLLQQGVKLIMRQARCYGFEKLHHDSPRPPQ